MKRLIFLLAFVLTLALTVYVIADEPGQASAGATGQYSPGAANAIATQGGNVTALNVSADISTSKWQGFWGNVSGSLQLGDGSDIFYNWSAATFQAIYASPGQDLDFSTISAIGSQGAREGKDTDYGFTSGDPDSINRTMSGSGCTAGTYLVSTSGVTPYNSTGQASSWTTCIGEDAGATVSDTVFATNIVDAGADAYNGQQVQFQLIVPVNETGQNYYFFLEI